MAGPPPSTQPSIKVIKQFTYRGQTKNYSNRYHFDNNSPGDLTKWTTFSDAVTAAERAAMHSSGAERIIGTVGYDAGSEIPVFSKTYSLAGTATFTAATIAAGDCCAMVRWSTGARSVKNHPIYFFSFMKPAYLGGAGGDLLNTVQKSTLQTYGAAWITGFSDGSVTHHRSGPQGHLSTGCIVDQWVRHRDFP